MDGLKICVTAQSTLIKSSQNADITVVAVLSIRKYLTDRGTESTNPFLRVCALLLEGIARSALAYDREEYGEFRAMLGKLEATLECTQDPDELLAVAETANATLEDYNRGAQRVHAAQTVELRCMIEMLSQTLVGLAEAGGHSVQTLQGIRNQVEIASKLDDIRLLRARLGDSLKLISDEAKRQRERNSEMLRQAEDAALIAAGHRTDPEIDRVSGLASPEKAESEIASRVGPESHYWAAVFVVERIESLNLRYGYTVGDQLLQIFGRTIKSKLSGDDTLFRWRGPSFVALLERKVPADALRTELARFASSRQEHVIQIEGRPLKLPLTCAWTIVQLAKCEIVAEVVQQIDRFVVEHGDKRS
jgi:GGDEF domain-containing protein